MRRTLLKRARKGAASYSYKKTPFNLIPELKIAANVFGTSLKPSTSQLIIAACND